MMKAKINRGGGFRGVVSYVHEKGDAEIVGGNMSGQTIQELTREFSITKKLRPDCKNPVWHCSLALPKGDRLSSEKWGELAMDFMREMDIDPANFLYSVARHSDTDHDHIHIVASRIGLDGQLWHGQKDVFKAIAATQKLEQRHHLTLTPGLDLDVKKDRKSLTHGELNMAIRTEMKPPRMICQEAIDTVLQMEGVISAPEFIERLEALGVRAGNYSPLSSDRRQPYPPYPTLPYAGGERSSRRTDSLRCPRVIQCSPFGLRQFDAKLLQCCWGTPRPDPHLPVAANRKTNNNPVTKHVFVKTLRQAGSKYSFESKNATRRPAYLNGELTPAQQRAVQRRVAAGELNRVRAGIATPLPESEWPALFKREKARVLAALFPNAVVSFRSAFDGMVGSTIYLVAGYSREVNLPGLKIIIFNGPGPVDGDTKIQGRELYFASRERMLLEASAPSQKDVGDAYSRRVSPQEIEERLISICDARGEAAFVAFRESTRRVAELLKAPKTRITELDHLMGAILGTRPDRKMSIAMANCNAFEKSLVQSQLLWPKTDDQTGAVPSC